MKKAIILCGIPNSGKSTWAEEYSHLHRSKMVVTMSRDKIRENSVYFEQPYFYTLYNETIVTNTFERELKFWINAKVDIIIDNTNCKEYYIDKAKTLLESNEYKVYIKFFYVSLFKAKWREFWRRFRIHRSVPFKVINDMKKNFDKLDKKKYQLIDYDYNFITI